MRLPVTANVYEKHEVTAQELLEKPELLGGARGRAPPARLVGYRWLLVCIDGPSKWAYIEEMAQSTPLDVGQTTTTPGAESVGSSSGRLGRASNDGDGGGDRGGNNNDDNDDADQDDEGDQQAPEDNDDNGWERDPKRRPQSSATYNAFKKFVRLANEVRREHARKTGMRLSSDYVMPRSAVHDQGREFSGEFQKGLARLRNRQPGFFNESITSNSRSQHNAICERAVRSFRRYFYAIKSAFERRPDPQKWHNKLQLQNAERGLPYNWVLDIPEVLRRYNGAYHTTIKATPLDALLEIVSPGLIKSRNIEAGKRRFEGLRHELRLPGFSPSAQSGPPEVGSFVRLKEYTSGSMGSNWPIDGAKNVNTKSASHNWSWDVYVVVKVRTIGYGVADAKAKQEELQNHVDAAEGSFPLTKAQKVELNNTVQPCRLYKVEPIDRRKVKHHQKGRRFGWLTRVDLLKIPDETRVEGRTLPELVLFYDKLAADEAVAAAAQAEERRRQPSGQLPRGRPRREAKPTRVGSPFKYGVRDTLIFSNADEIQKLIFEKTRKKVPAKGGEIDGDVVKISSVDDAYSVDFGDQRRRLLISFDRQQLENDDLVRLGQEEISFAFEIGSRVQFPRAWFRDEGWYGIDATSEAARYIGDGDDLRFDGQYLQGTVVSHEFDRSSRTRIKYFYGIRFHLNNRRQRPPTRLSTGVPQQAPPASIVVEDIPRSDIESAASGIPAARTQRSSSSSSSQSS